jgi:hypothetical protein
MPFPRPEPEPLSMSERVLLWALASLPVFAALLWVVGLLLDR